MYYVIICATQTDYVQSTSGVLLIFCTIKVMFLLCWSFYFILYYICLHYI